jgi:hypothetical protein
VTFRDKVLDALSGCNLSMSDRDLADAIVALHEEAVAEAVKPIWEVLHRHYPAIAGRVIGLDQLGETVAHERWAALARDFYDAEIAADALLSADKPKCEPPATEAKYRNPDAQCIYPYVDGSDYCWSYANHVDGRIGFEDMNAICRECEFWHKPPAPGAKEGR